MTTHDWYKKEQEHIGRMAPWERDDYLKAKKEHTEELFKINCAYNQDVENDICLAKNCMIRSSHQFDKEEKKNCKCFKKIQKRYPQM